MALGTVLACLAVLALILFCAVSATLSHLNVARQVSQRQHAQNLAEAALAEAIAGLAANDFNPLPDGRVEVSFQGLEDAEGIVTFDRDEFPDDFSSYRLKDPDRTTSAVGARGRTVPENSVHLVARGRVSNVVQWVECVYHRPPFPNGLIATGEVSASGLYLTGVSRGGSYQGGAPDTIEPSHRAPANLFSNARVELSGASLINGSVGAVGQVEMSPDCTVSGELRSACSDEEVPELDLAAKMATLVRNSYEVSSGTGDLTLVDGWFSHSPSDLHVPGNLDLNHSVLCVQGDLRVDQSVTGTGFVLVDGDVHIADGGSNVVGSDQIALAARGDVTLRPNSAQGNYFKGLIYSEGNLEARDITVVGAMVVNGKNGKAGTVELENVRFIYDPAGVTLNLRGPQGWRYDGQTIVGNAGDRTVGFSLSVRDGEGEDGYLADVEVYLSHNSKKKNLKAHQPKRWPDDKSNPPGQPAVVVSRKAVPFKIEELQQLSEQLAEEMIEEIIEYCKPPNVEKQPKAVATRRVIPGLAEQMEAGLRQVVDQETDDFELTFNLNNLLTRQTSDSRVLLWRPWRPGS